MVWQELNTAQRSSCWWFKKVSMRCVSWTDRNILKDTTFDTITYRNTINHFCTDWSARKVSGTVISNETNFSTLQAVRCRSQWPRGLRRRSAAARLLRSWVRIPQGASMFVCCNCFVLSGRGLRHELITRPKESYRLWCVVVCDLEKPQEWGGHDPLWAAGPQKKIYILCLCVDLGVAIGSGRVLIVLAAFGRCF